MLVGGHGEVNPNTNWLQSKGLWFSYCLGILAIHLVLLSIPFLTVPLAWTTTNIIHNIIHLIFLHTLKGTPWLSQDQGACRVLTHWEQIDNGIQFTQTRKFLSVVPIVLFFLTNFYTKYDPVHFYINFISLVIVLLPKLPHFHKIFTSTSENRMIKQTFVLFTSVILLNTSFYKNLYLSGQMRF